MSASAWLLVAGLLTGAYAPQQAGTVALPGPLETRVQALSKQLRCPMCQGLSIADSNASVARAQVDKVREMVATGQTDAQIRAYFVARYGEWALLDPPATGFNWLVWLGPLALLALGAGIILRMLRRAPPPAAHSEAGPADAPASAPVDPYVAAVRAELER